MSKMRRYLKAKGFTLIEILVVIVIIGVLSIMGVSKYTEFTTQSRTRGCISNENSIDKSMGVWESQNVAIPTSAGASVTFKTDGTTVANAGIPAAVPSASSLAAGSKVIFNFTKDANVFTCPERANVVGNTISSSSAETEYYWISNGTAPGALNGKIRGTCCINYGSAAGATRIAGPDGTTATTHMP